MSWIRSRARDPRSLTFLAVAALLGTAAALLGIDGNLGSFLLLVLAATALVAAAGVPWERPRSFLWLAAGGALGFPVLVVLHNALYAVGEITAGTPLVPELAGFLGVLTFLGAVLFAPACIVVGLGGAGIRAVQSRARAG